MFCSSCVILCQYYYGSFKTQLNGWSFFLLIVRCFWGYMLNGVLKCAGTTPINQKLQFRPRQGESSVACFVRQSQIAPHTGNFPGSSQHAYLDNARQGTEARGFMLRKCWQVQSHSPNTPQVQKASMMLPHVSAWLIGMRFRQRRKPWNWQPFDKRDCKGEKQTNDDD